MTHAGGRPTKLTDSMIELGWSYLDESDISTATLLPTVEGLALKLNIHRDTLYDWAKDNEEFSDILAKLKSKQADKLIQNSLAGRYNATIAKMILSGKHGYIEQSATDLTTNGKDLPVLVRFVGDDEPTND